MDLQGMWDATVRFCEDNSIWLIIAAELAAILLAVHAIKKDGRAKRKKEDAWMQDFEARMEAFEKNEDPLMPVRKPLLPILRGEAQDQDPMPEKIHIEETRCTQETKCTQEEPCAERPMNLSVKIRIDQLKISRELTEELTEVLQKHPDELAVTVSAAEKAEMPQEAVPRQDADVSAARTGNDTASGRSGRVYSEEELRRLIRK